MRTDFYVERKAWRECIELLVVQRDELGTMVAKPLEFERVAENTLAASPTMSMRVADAQLLMDELWRAGLRPTEGSGSAGSLAATERHLNDMQRIAFQLLGEEQQVANLGRERGASLMEVKP